MDKGKEGDRAAGGSYKRCMITGGSRATAENARTFNNYHREGTQAAPQ